MGPEAYSPTEYRGPLRSIKTKVAGQRFGEHFKNLAQVSDKITIINSMTHGEAAHERGVHNMFTGYRPEPGDQPSRASVAWSHTSLARATTCHPTSPIPSVANEHAGSGYLSSAYGPFSLGNDPAK